MGKEQELPKRTPEHIIGSGLLAQLIAAGYQVVPARDEQAEVGRFSAAKDAEDNILREYGLGNLSKLGVANHLRRAGFNLKYATEKANSLASPPAVAAGGVTEEMVEKALYAVMPNGSTFIDWIAIPNKADLEEFGIDSKNYVLDIVRAQQQRAHAEIVVRLALAAALPTPPSRGEGV